MLLATIIPVVLALSYSYGYDFQPQGRYYLPIVVPFMYFLAMGVEKMIGSLELLICKIAKLFDTKQNKVSELTSANTETSEKTIATLTGNFLFHLTYAFLAACLLYATFISMLGYYKTNDLSLF